METKTHESMIKLRTHTHTKCNIKNILKIEYKGEL